MSSHAKTTALKIAAVLAVIWGLVHLFAGLMVLFSDASGGFQAINDAVDPALLAHDYHGAVGGVLNQHGWNLGWFGIATIVGAFIWRGSQTGSGSRVLSAAWPIWGTSSFLTSKALCIFSRAQ